MTLLWQVLREKCLFQYDLSLYFSFSVQNLKVNIWAGFGHSGTCAILKMLDATSLYFLTLLFSWKIFFLSCHVEGYWDCFEASSIFQVGTVLNAKDAKSAINAGAKFLMSPAMVKVYVRSSNRIRFMTLNLNITSLRILSFCFCFF